MRPARKIVVIVLVALLGLTIYGRLLTSPKAVSQNRTSATSTGDGASEIDQAPLLTAQRLAQIPTTVTELPFAEEALRLGDQEMDQAFAAAVLDTVEHPPASASNSWSAELKFPFATSLAPPGAQKCVHN